MGSMPTGMVGRDAERSRLRALVEDPAEGSSALLVWGEAGIGKTSLVEELETVAAAGGYRVLRGGSSPLSADVPYAPIQAAVSAAAHDRGRAGLATARNRTEWYAGLDEALCAHGPAAGTLVVVEDVHWADAASLGYLAHLTRNLPERLVLAMTFRDGDADDLHQAWLAEQLRYPGVVSLPLGALTQDETVELVRLLDSRVSERRAQGVHRRSGGNPYLATELALVDRDGELPGTLRQVLRLRLRDVGTAATQVVAAAGAISRPTSDDELCAAVGDEASVRTAHDEELLESVPGDPGHCRARHPVLAELAYESLLPEQRRALHARLAARLESTLRAGAPAADVAEVAEHHRRAGHAEDSLVWAVRAADAAERECAFAEAGRWYSVAVDSWLNAPAVTGLVPARERLVEAAGRNLGVAGRHEAVIEVLGRFLDEPDDEQRVDTGAALLVHRSWARFVQGDTDGARGDLDRALAESTHDGDPSLQADVYAQRAMIEGTCSRWDVAEDAARQADRLGRESGNRRAQGRAATVLGAADVFVHAQIHRGLALLRRGLETAWELGEPDDYSLAAVCLQSYYLDTGDATSASSVSTWLRRHLRLLAPEGHWMDGMMRGNQMRALFATGEWERALAVGSECPDEIGFAEMELALVHSHRGDVAQARTSLERCADLDRRDQPQFFVSYHETEARLALLENDPRRALSAVLLASEVCREIPDVIGESGPLLLVGLRAAVLLPDEAAFERLLDTLGVAASSSDRREPIALQVAAERSLLRASPDAASRWQECVDAWDSLGRPYETAVARVRVAEALLRRPGGRRAAAEALSAALATALELGAVPLRDEITALARTARLRLDTARAPERGATAVLGLTDREQQVLALVAQGRTNREIGEQLYMSPKTASVHVTRILQKLGVSTRVQAATVAATHGLLPPPALTGAATPTPS